MKIKSFALFERDDINTFKLIDSIFEKIRSSIELDFNSSDNKK